LKKYIEIGLGNRWLVRTEFEREDGSEYEVKGWARPFRLESIYFRVWVGTSVLILDSKEGLKWHTKKRRSLKIIFGLKGH